MKRLVPLMKISAAVAAVLVAGNCLRPKHVDWCRVATPSGKMEPTGRVVRLQLIRTLYRTIMAEPPSSTEILTSCTTKILGSGLSTTISETARVQM